MENINIDEMFEHYIEKKRAGRREPQGSYNEAWLPERHKRLSSGWENLGWIPVLKPLIP